MTSIKNTKGITVDECIEVIIATKRAMRPVVQEIKDKLPTPSAQNYNPNYHVEITLSIAECRAILEAMKR